MKYRTIYFPGNGNCLHQASKYTNQNINGVYARDHLNLLINPITDIQPYDVETVATSTIWHQIIMWLLFPIYYLTFWINGIYNITPYYTNLVKVNLAQYSDANHYVKAIEDTIQKYPRDKLILYGCSKGASTIISVLYHMNREKYNHIGLIVLEGVFDDVQTVLQYRFGKLAPLISWGLVQFTQYNPYYSTPKEMASKLQLPMPVVIISSQTDRIVPYQSSLNIYNQLVAGGNKVQLISLKNSSHSNYVGDDVADINKYYTSMNTIYESLDKNI